MSQFFASLLGDARISLRTLARSLGFTVTALPLLGLVARSVARRACEFGLKMALSADPQCILRDTLTGLAAAFALSTQLTDYLYRVDPRDPLLYLAMGAASLLASGLGAWAPARKTTRISPLEALRHE